MSFHIKLGMGIKWIIVIVTYFHHEIFDPNYDEGVEIISKDTMMKGF